MSWGFGPLLAGGVEAQIVNVSLTSQTMSVEQTTLTSSNISQGVNKDITAQTISSAAGTPTDSIAIALVDYLAVAIGQGSPPPPSFGLVSQTIATAQQSITSNEIVTLEVGNNLFTITASRGNITTTVTGDVTLPGLDVTSEQGTPLEEVAPTLAIVDPVEGNDRYYAEFELTLLGVQSVYHEMGYVNEPPPLGIDAPLGTTLPANDLLTLSIGDVYPSVEESISAQTATFEEQTPVEDIVEGLDNLYIGVNLGTPVAAVAGVPLAQTITSSIADIGVNEVIEPRLAAQTITTSQGVVLQDITDTIELDGLTITSSIADIEANEVIAPRLTAQTISSSQGVFLEDNVESIEAQTVTSNIGSISWSSFVALEAQTITSQITSDPLLEALVEGIDNLFIGANQGNLSTAIGDSNLSFQQITSQQGSISWSSFANVTAQTITSSTGSLATNELNEESIAAQTITSAIGNVSTFITGAPSIAAQTITSALGTPLEEVAPSLRRATAIEGNDRYYTEYELTLLGYVSSFIESGYFNEPPPLEILAPLGVTLSSQEITSEISDVYPALGEFIFAQTATFEEQTPVEDIVEGLDNLFIGTNLGTPVPAVAPALTAQTSTVEIAANADGEAVAPSIAAQTITSALGTPTEDVTETIELDGLVITSEFASLDGNEVVAPRLAAQTVTSEIGSVNTLEDNTESIESQTISTSIGNVTWSSTVSLSAQEVTSEITSDPLLESIEETLDALVVTTSLGTPKADISELDVYALDVTVRPGDISWSSFANVTAQTISSQQGSLETQEDNVESIEAQTATVNQGSISWSSFVSLSSQEITSQITSDPLLEAIVENLDLLFIGANQGTPVPDIVEADTPPLTVTSQIGSVTWSSFANVAAQTISSAQGVFLEDNQESIAAQTITSSIGDVTTNVTGSPLIEAQTIESQLGTPLDQVAPTLTRATAVEGNDRYYTEFSLTLHGVVSGYTDYGYFNEPPPLDIYNPIDVSISAQTITFDITSVDGSEVVIPTLTAQTATFASQTPVEDIVEGLDNLYIGVNQGNVAKSVNGILNSQTFIASIGTVDENEVIEPALVYQAITPAIGTVYPVNSSSLAGATQLITSGTTSLDSNEVVAPQLAAQTITSQIASDPLLEAIVDFDVSVLVVESQIGSVVTTVTGAPSIAAQTITSGTTSIAGNEVVEPRLVAQTATFEEQTPIEDIVEDLDNLFIGVNLGTPVAHVEKAALITQLFVSDYGNISENVGGNTEAQTVTSEIGSVTTQNDESIEAQTITSERGVTNPTVEPVLAAQTITSAIGDVAVNELVDETIEAQSVALLQGSIEAVAEYSIAAQTVESQYAETVEDIVEGLDNLFIGAEQGSVLPYTEISISESLAATAQQGSILQDVGGNPLAQTATFTQGEPEAKGEKTLFSIELTVTQGEPEANYGQTLVIEDGLDILLEQGELEQEVIEPGYDLITRSYQGNLPPPTITNRIARQSIPVEFNDEGGYNVDVSIRAQSIYSRYSNVTKQTSGEVTLVTVAGQNDLVFTTSDVIKLQSIDLPPQTIYGRLRAVIDTVTESVNPLTVTTRQGNVTPGVGGNVEAQLVDIQTGIPIPDRRVWIDTQRVDTNIGDIETIQSPVVASQVVSITQNNAIERVVERLDNLFIGVNAGAVTSSVGEIVSQQTINAAQGNVKIGKGHNLDSLDITIDQGTPVAGVEERIFRTLMNIDQGVVDTTVGVVASISGFDISVDQGNVTKRVVYSRLITSQEITSQQGSIVEVVEEKVDPLRIIARVGSVRAVIGSSIDTQTVDIEIGSVTERITNRLASQAIQSQQGVIGENVDEKADPLTIVSRIGSVKAAVATPLEAQTVESAIGDVTTTITSTVVEVNVASVTITSGIGSVRAVVGAVINDQTIATEIGDVEALERLPSQVITSQRGITRARIEVGLTGLAINIAQSDLVEEDKEHLQSLTVALGQGNVTKTIVARPYDILIGGIDFQPVVNAKDHYAINMVNGSVESSNAIAGKVAAINMVNGDPSSDTLIKAQVYNYV